MSPVQWYQHSRLLWFVHFALSFLTAECWCLFHLARCIRASWQPQVTCVSLLLSRCRPTGAFEVHHRFTGASTLPGASGPGGFFQAACCTKASQWLSWLLWHPFWVRQPFWLWCADVAQSSFVFKTCITVAGLHLFACFHLKMLCECLKCPLPLQLIAKGCFTIHKIATIVCRLSKTQKGEFS